MKIFFQKIGLIFFVNLVAVPLWATALNDAQSWIVEKLEFGVAGTENYYCAEIYRLPGQGQYRFKNWCVYAPPRLKQAQYSLTLRPALLMSTDVNQICTNWRLMGSPTLSSGNVEALGATLSVPALSIDEVTKGRATDGVMLSLQDLQNPPQSMTPNLRAFVGGVNSITGEHLPGALNSALSTLLSQRLAMAKIDANGMLTISLNDQAEFACQIAQQISFVRGFYETSWGANPTVTDVQDINIDQFVPLFAKYWSQPLVQATSSNSWQQLINAVMFGVALVEDSKTNNLDIDKFLNQPASSSNLLLRLLTAINWNPLQLDKSTLQNASGPYDVAAMNSYRSLANFSLPTSPQEIDTRSNCENCMGELVGPIVQIVKADGGQP